MTTLKFAETTFRDGVGYLIAGYNAVARLPETQLAFTELGWEARIPLPSEVRAHHEESVVYGVIQNLKFHDCDACQPLMLWICESFAAPENSTPLDLMMNVWVRGRLDGAIRDFSGPDLAAAADAESESYERWIAGLEAALIEVLHGQRKLASTLGQGPGQKLWRKFAGGVA